MWGEIYEKKPHQEATEFRESRKAEWDGLIDNGTLAEVDKTNLPSKTRLLGSRFIDMLKQSHDENRRKSRLISQNYGTKAQGVYPQRPLQSNFFTHRTILRISPSIPHARAFTRDNTQAYVQSEKQLEHPVYIQQPREMCQPPNIVWKVIRPLYFIAESGLHRYLTYLQHHVERLGKHRSVIYSCIIILHNSNAQMERLVELQVEDTLEIGTETFLKDEERAAGRFK